MLNAGIRLIMDSIVTMMNQGKFKHDNVGCQVTYKKTSDDIGRT